MFAWVYNRKKIKITSLVYNRLHIHLRVLFISLIRGLFWTCVYIHEAVSETSRTICSCWNFYIFFFFLWDVQVTPHDRPWTDVYSIRRLAEKTRSFSIAGDGGLVHGTVIEATPSGGWLVILLKQNTYITWVGKILFFLKYLKWIFEYIRRIVYSGYTFLIIMYRKLF